LLENERQGLDQEQIDRKGIRQGWIFSMGVRGTPPIQLYFSEYMAVEDASATDYDTVELRAGHLHKIRRSEARMLGEEDRTVQVAKCYCRTHDVITAADAERQERPTFVFPVRFFKNLETLIGSDLKGRVYSDSEHRRVKFHLDVREHAGFQLEGNHSILQSPWYDDSVLKE
jgi:hypothetical protein